jgi:hypothetical protein
MFVLRGYEKEGFFALENVVIDRGASKIDVKVSIAVGY